MSCPCDAVLWCAAGELWQARVFQANSGAYDPRPHVWLRGRSGRSVVNSNSDGTYMYEPLHISPDCPLNEDGVIRHD